MAAHKPIEILPSGKRVFGRNAEGKPICNALALDGSGRRCQSVFTLDNGRCKKHKGMALHSGANNPNYKNGQFSRYGALPPEKLQKYQQALANPDLLSLAPDIAFIDVRIAEIVSRLDNSLEESSLERYSDIAREAYAVLTSGIDEEEEISELRRVVWAFYYATKKAEEERKDETLLVDRVKLRKELVETELKVKNQSVITETDLWQFITRMAFAIGRWVKDPDALRGLRQEIKPIGLAIDRLRALPGGIEGIAAAREPQQVIEPDPDVIDVEVEEEDG